jgi:hypothetical protein
MLVRAIQGQGRYARVVKDGRSKSTDFQWSAYWDIARRM